MSENEPRAVENLTYFAHDGSWGDAAGLTIIDTTAWTNEDYEKLDGVSDENLPDAAVAVSDWVEAGRERTDEFVSRFAAVGVEW